MTIEDFHSIITQKIKDENEIRNQRIKWFLIIQGFLIAGICTIIDKESKILTSCLINIYTQISILGFVVSISFWYAGWRSMKSISMALASWHMFLLKEKMKYEDFPPISLITKEIIKGGFNNEEDATAINSWIKKLGEHMYLNNPCLKCRDTLLNRTDWLMPFLFLPSIFGLFWALVFILLIK